MSSASAPAPRRSLAIAASDPGEAEAIRRIVAAEDLDTFLVGSAAELRALLAAQVPDLIVIDHRLPDEPGFVLCRELRDDPRTRRVSIVVLLPPQGTTVEECFVSGVNDFLGRPLDEGEIARKVDRLSRVPDRRRLQTLALIKLDSGEATLLGRAVNVSPSGILLEVDAKLGVGAPCEVRFNLPGQSEPVRARGTIRRRAKEPGLTSGGYGIEFVSLGPDDRGRLGRFLGHGGEGGR